MEEPADTNNNKPSPGAFHALSIYYVVNACVGARSTASSRKLFLFKIFNNFRIKESIIMAGPGVWIGSLALMNLGDPFSS